MSRLDLILSIVDKLEARSNDILSTVEDSNRLINHLASMNEEITSLDSSIEDIGDLLSDNTNNMNQFSNLYEKSFYLESNLDVNDIITSQTSFETLTNEFHHLVKRLERNDYYSRVPYVDHRQNEDSLYQNENSIHHNKDSTHHNESDESVQDMSYEVPSHMETVYEAPSHMDTAYDSPLNKITPTTFHPDTPPTVPQMHNKVSLSNLKLKPIRCNSTKLYKKKSRYRLSGIYNINPIAYEESQFLSGLDDDSCASPQLATIDLFTPKDLLEPQDFTDERFTPQDFTERFAVGDFADADQLTPDSSTFGEASAYRNIIPSSETPAYRNIVPSISDHTNISSNIMHNEDPIDIDNDISFQPDELNSLASSPSNETAIYKRLRSNSLPEGHLIDNSNILGDFEISDPEKLRMNRLKSFISYHNIHKSVEIHPQSGETYFSKSPPTASLNIDHTDEFENISICSDLSYYSPAKQTPTLDVQEEFDNFDKYLRQSRIDLRNAFPDTITKASSHESIFQSEIEVLTKPYKFHNPAESMMLGSSKVSAATVFYDNDHSAKSKKSVSFAETQDPKKFLSEVMLRNDHTSKPPPPVMLPPESPSKFNNFSIFNFAMNSPSKQSMNSPSKQTIHSQERRNSMDHISNSLTDTFKNLVNTTAVTPKPKKLSYPEKKKRELELKLHPISNEVRPITIKNEIHTKRLPIRIPRNDGSSSQLTIGPNNTKIINHGERSAFKRPVMTSISRNSLRDALSSSML